MTLKEAKKILESEGFVPERFLGVLVEDVKAASWEKIEVGEAMKVVAENGYFPFMEKSKYEERKARLKKEYEKNTKAPGSGEEQSKEGDLKAATKMFGAQAREIMRLTAENAELRETIDKMKEGNPALKEALKESASQFNDALLDEQAKKIKSLVKDITHMDNVIYKKNLEIEELKKKVAEKTKLVEMVRNGSKEYCDYGVAANEFIKELAHLYVLADKNGNINVEMLERCKNYQTYGFPANCNRETKKEINDIARGKENKKPRIHTPEEPKYDSIIERCKRLGIELHYHDGKVPTYTNMYGNEVPVYGLRGIFAICTDEEYKSLFKK